MHKDAIAVLELLRGHCAISAAGRFASGRKGICSARRFTLIELLVVIAIISMLMSIMLPSLSRARDLAKSTNCKNNLKQLGITLHNYSSDFDAYIPPCTYGGPGSFYHDFVPNRGGVWLYYESPNYTGLGIMYKSGHVTYPKLYYCPAAPDEETWGYSAPHGWNNANYKRARYYYRHSFGLSSQVSSPAKSVKMDILASKAAVWDAIYSATEQTWHKSGHSVLFYDCSVLNTNSKSYLQFPVNTDYGGGDGTDISYNFHLVADGLR